MNKDPILLEHIQKRIAQITQYTKPGHQEFLIMNNYNWRLKLHFRKLVIRLDGCLLN